MRANSKLTFKMLLILAAFISSVNCAFAWTYTASGQWASFNFGSWTVYQDEWGSSASCMLYANSASNWASAGSWTGGGTKGYPHVQGDPNIPIGSNKCTANFNFSGPSGATYTLVFDCWTANMADEIMIEEAWGGSKGHWGSQIASNVTIGGRNYQSIWQASNGANPVYIFTPSSQKTSGTTDIMAVFVWLKNRGSLHNSTLHEVSFGPEITSTNGWQQFTMNSFSANWTSKSAEENSEELSTLNEGKSDVLYPNPFTSEITLSINNPEQVTSIVVTDLLGRKVEIIDHAAVKSLQTIGSSLKAGTYIVQVNRSGKTQSFAVIKK